MIVKGYLVHDENVFLNCHGKVNQHLNELRCEMSALGGTKGVKMTVNI